MRRPHRTARSARRPPRPPRSPRIPGPIIATVVVLALALLSQAGLSALAQGLSHLEPSIQASLGALADRGGTGPTGHRGEALGVAGVVHPDAADGSKTNDHLRSPADRRPGHPPKSCDLCALIAVGKLGWTVPTPAVIDGPALIVWTRGVRPVSRSLRPSLSSAAPRGPPTAV